MVNHFYGNFHSKTLGCRLSVFRDVKWCFNASWGLKGLNNKALMVKTEQHNFLFVSGAEFFVTFLARYASAHSTYIGYDSHSESSRSLWLHTLQSYLRGTHAHSTTATTRQVGNHGSCFPCKKIIIFFYLIAVIIFLMYWRIYWSCLSLDWSSWTGVSYTN